MSNIITAALSGDMHVNVPKREEEAQRIAYWMLDDWRSRGVHFIGIAGDLVDGPMTERQRAWLIEYLVQCSYVAPVVVIEGNHEVVLALRNAVGRFRDVRRPGLYPIIVEDAAGVHVVETTAGKLAVACVSYPRKAQLLAAVGPASNEEADAIAGQALQDLFRGLGTRVRELGLPTVALVHGTIAGSKISEEQPDRPLGLEMSPIDLEQIEADFYCVGHIHLEQSWNTASAVIATPGCPFFCDWGEAKYNKSYLLVELR
jgi:DNA repair exonuclease SbcCD nuclease subunit